MRYGILILSTLLIIGVGLTGLKAQETIPASGGVASGNGGQVTYTVGQIVYTTNSGVKGSVAQGVQQPYEISIVQGSDEYDGIRLLCSIYPNPTSDNVKLQIDNYIENLTYYLYDINGKMLETKKIESKETIIQMGNLVPATYFLKIVQTMPTTSIQKIKTFKIIKKN